MLNPRLAQRGSVCEAAVPDSTYFRAHPCELRHGLKKCGSRWFCAHHRKMWQAGRL